MMGIESNQDVRVLLDWMAQVAVRSAADLLTTHSSELSVTGLGHALEAHAEARVLRHMLAPWARHAVRWETPVPTLEPWDAGQCASALRWCSRQAAWQLGPCDGRDPFFRELRFRFDSIGIDADMLQATMSRASTRDEDLPEQLQRFEVSQLVLDEVA